MQYIAEAEGYFDSGTHGLGEIEFQTASTKPFDSENDESAVAFLNQYLYWGICSVRLYGILQTGGKELVPTKYVNSNGEHRLEIVPI